MQYICRIYFIVSIFVACLAATEPASLSQAAEPSADTTSLVILYTSDTNGQLESCD